MAYKHNIYKETKNINKNLIRSPLNSHWLDLKYKSQKWWYLIFLLSYIIFPRSKFDFTNNQFNIDLMHKVKKEYWSKFPLNKFAPFSARNKQKNKLNKKSSNLIEKIKYKNHLIQQPIESLPLLPDWASESNVVKNFTVNSPTLYDNSINSYKQKINKIRSKAITSDSIQQFYYPAKIQKYGQKSVTYSYNKPYITQKILTDLQLFKENNCDLHTILDNKIQYLLQTPVKSKLKSKKIYRHIRNNTAQLPLKTSSKTLTRYTYNLLTQFIGDTPTNEALHLFKRDLIQGHNLNIFQVTERMRLDNIETTHIKPLEKLLVWDQSNITTLHKEEFIDKLIFQLEICSQLLNSRINLQHGIQKELVGKSLEHIDTEATGLMSNLKISGFLEEAKQINQLLILLTNNLLLKRHALFYTGFVRTEVKRLNDEEEAEEQARMDEKAGKKPVKKPEDEGKTLLTEEERAKIRVIRSNNNAEIRQIYDYALEPFKNRFKKYAFHPVPPFEEVRDLVEQSGVKYHKFHYLLQKYQAAQKAQYDNEEASIEGLDAFEENIDEAVPRDCKIVDGYDESIEIVIDQILEGIIPLIDLDKMGEAKSSIYLTPDLVLNHNIRLLDIIKSNINLLKNLQKYVNHDLSKTELNEVSIENPPFTSDFNLLAEERILHHPIEYSNAFNKIVETFKNVCSLVDETNIIFKTPDLKQPENIQTTIKIDKNDKVSEKFVIRQNPLLQNAKTIASPYKAINRVERKLKRLANAAIIMDIPQTNPKTVTNKYFDLNPKQIDDFLYLMTHEPEEEISIALSKINNTKRYLRKIYKKARLEYKTARREIENRYRREKKQKEIELKKKIREVTKMVNIFEKQPELAKQTEVANETYDLLKRQLEQLLAQQQIERGFDPDGSQPIDLDDESLTRGIVEPANKTNDTEDENTDSKKPGEIKPLTPRQLRRLEKRKRQLRKFLLYLGWLKNHPVDLEYLKFTRQQQRFARQHFKNVAKTRVHRKIKYRKVTKFQAIKDLETFKVYKRARKKFKEYLLSNLNTAYCDEKFIQLINQEQNNQKIWGFQDLYEIFRKMQLRNESYNIAKIHNINASGPFNSHIPTDTNTSMFEIDEDEEKPLEKTLAQELGYDYDEHLKYDDEEQEDDEDDTTLVDTIDHGSIESQERRYTLHNSGSEMEPRFLDDKELREKFFFTPIPVEFDEKQVSKEHALTETEIATECAEYQPELTAFMKKALSEEKKKYETFQSTPFSDDDEHARLYYPGPVTIDALTDPGNNEIADELSEAPPNLEEYLVFDMPTEAERHEEPLKKEDIPDDDSEENSYYITTIDFKEKDGNSNKYYTNKATTWINHRLEKTFGRLQHNVANVKFLLTTRKQMLIHNHINQILSPGITGFILYDFLTQQSDITPTNMHTVINRSVTHLRLRGSKTLNFASLGNIPLERNIVQKITQDYSLTKTLHSNISENKNKTQLLNSPVIDYYQAPSTRRKHKSTYKKVSSIFHLINKAWRLSNFIRNQDIAKGIIDFSDFERLEWESTIKQLYKEREYWDTFLDYADQGDIRRSEWLSKLAAHHLDFIEGEGEFKKFINSLEREGSFSFKISGDEYTNELIWSAFGSFYHLNKEFGFELDKKFLLDNNYFQSLFSANENNIFSISTYLDNIIPPSTTRTPTYSPTLNRKFIPLFNPRSKRKRQLNYLPFQISSLVERLEYANQLNFMYDLALGDISLATQYGLRFRHLPPKRKEAAFYMALYYQAIMEVCAPSCADSFLEASYFENIDDIFDQEDEIETEKFDLLYSLTQVPLLKRDKLSIPFGQERLIPLIFKSYKILRKLFEYRVPSTLPLRLEDQLNQINFRDETDLMDTVNKEFLNPLNVNTQYQPDYLHPSYNQRLKQATLLDKNQTKTSKFQLKYKFTNIPSIPKKVYKRRFRRIEQIRNFKENHQTGESFPLTIGPDFLNHVQNLLKSSVPGDDSNAIKPHLIQDKFLTNLQLQNLSTQNYINLFSNLHNTLNEKQNNIYERNYNNRLALRFESYFPNETHDDLIQIATSLNNFLRKAARQSQLSNQILINNPKLLDINKLFSIFSKTGLRKIGRRQLKRNTFFNNKYKNLVIQDATMFANTCNWSNWYLNKITNSKREALLNTQSFETNSLRRNEFFEDMIDSQTTSKWVKLDEAKLKGYTWPAFEDSTPYTNSNKLTRKHKRVVERQLRKFLKQFDKLSTEVIDTYSKNTKIHFTSDERAKYETLKDNRDSIKAKLRFLQELVDDFEKREILRMHEISPDTIMRNFSFLLENHEEEPEDIYAPDILPYRVYLRLMLENLNNFQIPKTPKYIPNFGGPAVETGRSPITPTRFKTRKFSLPGFWGQPREIRRSKSIIDLKEELEWYPFAEDGFDTVEKSRLGRLNSYYHLSNFMSTYIRDIYFEPYNSLDDEEDAQTHDPEDLNEFTRNIKINESISKRQVDKFKNLSVLSKQSIDNHNHEIFTIDTVKARNAKAVSLERPQFGKSDRFIWPGPFSNSHDQLIILSIVLGSLIYYAYLFFSLFILKIPGSEESKGFIRDERRLHILSRKFYSVSLITNLQFHVILSEWALKRAEFLNYNVTRTPTVIPFYWGEMHGVLEQILSYKPHMYQHQTFIDFTYNPFAWITSSFSSEHFTVSSLGSPRYAQAWIQAMFTTENITNLHVDLYNFLRTNVEKRKKFVIFDDGSIALEYKPVIFKSQKGNRLKINWSRLPVFQTGQRARKARMRKNRAIRRKVFFPERTFERLIHLAREYAPCFIVIDGFDRAVLSQKAFNVWNKEGSYGYWSGGIYGSFGKIPYDNTKTLKLQETIIRYLCNMTDKVAQTKLYKFCLTVPDSTRLDYRLSLPKRFYFRYILEDRLKLSAQDMHIGRYGNEPNFDQPMNLDFFELKCPAQLYNEYYNYYSLYRLQSIKSDYRPNRKEMRHDNLNVLTFTNLELFNDNLIWYGRDPSRPLEGRTDPREYTNRYLKAQVFASSVERSDRARWFNSAERTVPGYLFLNQWLQLTTVRRIGQFEYVMAWLPEEHKPLLTNQNRSTLAFCFNVSNIRKTILLRFYLNLYFFVQLFLILQNIE